jgi:hypothetical protein
MGKYRKEDSYYEDQYDRLTIEILKELEKNSKVPLKPPRHIQEPKEGSKIPFIIEEQYNALTPFYEQAVSRARSRGTSIRQSRFGDEEKDRLVANNHEPQNIKCNTCNCRMHLTTHIFNEKDRILFVYDCPKKHFPRKATYSNGDEYFFKKRTCLNCGSDDITSSSKKTKKILKSKDKCNYCGEVSEDVFDLTYQPVLPITDDDRKKYCLDFKNSTTFMEDVKSLADLHDSFEKVLLKKKINEEYKIDELEKVNLPQLEERLIKLTEENKFKKLQFKSPDMGRHVTVEFSIQDASTRTEKESKKLIVKILQEYLVKTNWRLVSPDNIHYRLGIISGKLKAHETEEDLLMLAKKIKESTKN